MEEVEEVKERPHLELVVMVIEGEEAAEEGSLLENSREVQWMSSPSSLQQQQAIELRKCYRQSLSIFELM